MEALEIGPLGHLVRAQPVVLLEQKCARDAVTILNQAGVAIHV